MTPQDIGASLKTLEGLAPAARSTGSTATTAAGIDRTDYQSCVAVVHIGAATGSPSSFSAAFKLQESDDDSTWTDVEDSDVTITAAGLTEVDVNLAAAKKYLRASLATTITGGTTPTLPSSCAIVFGGARNLPV